MQVKIKSSKAGRAVSADFDFGATLDETVEIFGVKVVHGRAVQKLKIAVQDYGRGLLEADGEDALTDEEVVEKLMVWKPGITAPRSRDKKTSIINKVRQLSPEERAQLIAELQAEQ